MRAQLLVAGVSFTSFLLLAVACGTETTYVYEDAGPGAATGTSSGTSGKSSSGSSGNSSGDDDDTTGDDDDDITPGKDAGKDGSASSGFPTLPSTKLVDDPSANTLLGVIGDDVIYRSDAAGGSKVFAIPVGGGPVTEVFSLTAGASNPIGLVGNVVARWHDLAANSKNVGTLDVWSRASGAKANVAENSYVGKLWSSADGKRIAFTKDTILTDGATPAPKATTLLVSTLADGTVLGTVSDPGEGGQINLLATSTCPLRASFLKNRFVAMFCNGEAPNQDAARMITMPEAGTAFVRVDAPTLASANRLSGKVAFSGDAAGTKVVAAANSTQKGQVYTLATPQDNVLELEPVALAKMAADGGNVIYLTSAGDLKAVKPVSPLGTPAALASGVKTLSVSPGTGKYVVFSKLAQDPATHFVDLNIVDATAATPTATAVIADAKVSPLGFTGTDGEFVYIDGSGSTDTMASLKLMSVATAGGTPKNLAPTVDDIAGGRPATDGTGFIFFTNFKSGTSSSPALADLNYVDASTGGQPKSIATSVPVAPAEYAISGKKVAFTRFASGGGISALTLP